MFEKTNGRLTPWYHQIPLFIFIHLITGMGCSSKTTYDLSQNIGLYKIIDKKCNIMPGTFNPCDTTHFLEIVKGQFFGIKNTDIGLIFWSGNNKLNPVLGYETHLIKNHTNVQLTGDRVWLTHNDHTLEYFIVKKNRLIQHVITIMGNKSEVIRHIEYTLKPELRSNQPTFKLNYPPEISDF